MRDADLCVKCGLCLPHCPTYGVARDEGDSPRGRIALMQGLAAGVLEATPAVERHLDGCLVCRACETACPAGVPYGRMIASARDLLAERRPGRGRAARLSAAVLANDSTRLAVAFVLWLYQRTGLQWLARALHLLGRGRLARLDGLLPRLHLPRRPSTRVHAGAPVALFTNCTSPMVEPEAAAGAVRLLEALGCAVSVPAAQGCCGALHHHAGAREAATACARRNVGAFAQAEIVVGVASGCTAQLREYGALLGPPGASFAQKTLDVHAFIAAHPALPGLAFAPLPVRALLHTPCTQRHAVRADGAVRALLARIPQLQLVEMDRACCGAGGSNVLSEPAMADALVAAHVTRVRDERPDFILSSNVGCAMHLSGALRRAGLSVPVVPPLALLAQQAAASRASPGAAESIPPARPG